VRRSAANNLQETNRMGVNACQKDEIYLKGFEITVKESQPWTVMSSYNLFNGTYISERPFNNHTIDEWGSKD
jgi:beta-glucosidase